jgi:hypothetical protein
MQGEEGALSLTTKEQSPDAVVKGRPLNYCAGFRPKKIATEQCRNPDGLLREAFALEVKARDYGIAPTSTPRTDRSVSYTYPFIWRLNFEIKLKCCWMQKS